MKGFGFILIFVASLLPAFAQETNVVADPFCGFIAGPHFYYETTQVKQGLSVDTFIAEPAANQTVTLRFFVNQKPRNLPVDQLQIEHEKFVHVVGVRDDLKEFLHLHPVKISPGLWAINHTFTQPGKYKLWTDLKSRGTSYSFGHPLISVSAGDGQNPDHALPPAKSPFTVTLKHSEPLATGKTNQLQFLIRDASGNQVETENYLGASMHLVLVKDDLSVYLHAHPEKSRDTTAPIRFLQNFKHEGHYKLYAQFRNRDAKLPKDEAFLEKFDITVTGTSAATGGPATRAGGF